ncbi:hypothetical protein [Staphylococcus aureus]|uniref:hypothetical protein n=1 Tax=Staphylococcus aureus TaxID=1280 RepID=UPI00178C6881|nr:hypothetical protein [Staphylococcus aureus]
MRHGLFDEQQLEVWLQAIIGNMDTKDVKDGFFIFYGGKVKLPAFFNTQKAQLPL